MNSPSRLTIIDVQTAVTIGDGSLGGTALYSIVITKILVGTCVITGFKKSDGTAESVVLPAGSAVGEHKFYGASNEAGPLTITCSNAGDANYVSAVWKNEKI